MWNDVRNSGAGLAWVMTALEGGTGVWVTDGSFMLDLRTDVSGVGWVFYCTKTGHKLAGSFYEESAQASSYQAERLGLLGIHLLLAAITHHSGIRPRKTKIVATTKGACVHPQNGARG